MIKSAIVKMLVVPLMWVADLKSLIRDTGRVIDFDYMETLPGVNQFRRGGFIVKLAEAVSIGETTGISVDALEYPLNKGAKINYGSYDPVVVTVGAAGALAGATTVPVDALSGPIPKGQVIHLGTNKFIVLNANAAEGATSLTTLAIPTDLVDNDTGTWQGGEKNLILVADAEEGAVSIDVEAPTFEFADDEEGWAIVKFASRQNDNAIFIPESTVLVEVDPDTNRKMIPLTLHPDGTSATGQIAVLLTNAKNDSRTDALSGYGVTYGGSLFENLMADAIKNSTSPGTLPTGWKTLLGARYIWLKSRDARGE